MSTLSERIAARQAGFTADIKTDDFTALCELVRRLCGVDLLQYKRGQMERRVRTFAQRRGTPDLAAYGARLKADKEELDAFLDRVTINVSHLWRHEDQWTALGKTILPELAEPSGPGPLLERRLVLRRRGLHAGGDRARIRSRARGSRSTAPTSTSAWSPAPAPAASRAEDARTAPPGAAEEVVRPGR